jgi:hypothetical protein
MSLISLDSEPQPTRRYPLTALLAVAGAWLAFAILVLAGAFFCILLVPLIPFYVVAIVSSGGLLSAAHDYAKRQAIVETSRLRVSRDAHQPSPAVAPRAA